MCLEEENKAWGQPGIIPFIFFCYRDLLGAGVTVLSEKVWMEVDLPSASYFPCSLTGPYWFPYINKSRLGGFLVGTSGSHLIQVPCYRHINWQIKSRHCIWKYRTFPLSVNKSRFLTSWLCFTGAALSDLIYEIYSELWSFNLLVVCPKLLYLIKMLIFISLHHWIWYKRYLM